MAKIKYFRGILKIFSEKIKKKDNKKGIPISPIAEEVLRICDNDDGTRLLQNSKEAGRGTHL